MYKEFLIRLISAISPILALSALILSSYHSLVHFALLALLLGLRHGLDADHILAIDSVSRNLISQGKPSLNVGIYFALGHSSIVFLLTLAIIGGVASWFSHTYNLAQIGNILGVVVSVSFLWLTALLNLVNLKSWLKSSATVADNSSFTFFLAKSVFKLVDKPQKCL
jgi:high-affinity nickel-transport protein